MKRRLAVSLLQAIAGSVAISALICSSAYAADKDLVGISFPSKISARWIADGNNIVKVLKEKGFNPDLQYAEDDVPNQIQQITSMINKGAKVLLIAAIDGSSLNNVLQTAADKGIKVIAYDRLIRGTKNVDYCVTFDNYQVGVMQGTYIEKALELKGGKGPFNIELFAGSADDSNAKFYYDGAMSVLKPYITKGKLVVRSKEIDLEKVATLRWAPLVARARMDKILRSSYSDKEKVDVVLSPNDGLGLGVLASLKSAGYGSGSVKLPLVTGQDGGLEAVKSVAKGELRFTIFKDTSELAKAAGSMVEASLNGKKLAINDTKSYNNGVKVVPAQLLKPLLVDATNWKRVFVDGGLYTEAQLK